MRVYVQTADRPEIALFPFLEVYEGTLSEVSGESIRYFHSYLVEEHPKAKRILIELSKADLMAKPAPRGEEAA